MDNYIDKNEKLFRSIRPNNVYWKDKERGIISSAAFKDSKGLSVDRQAERSFDASVKLMKENFTGTVVYVTAGLCYDKNAIVDYCPTSDDIYHCEIIRSYEKKQLSSSQAKYLANNAVICG